MLPAWYAWDAILGKQTASNSGGDTRSCNVCKGIAEAELDVLSTLGSAVEDHLLSVPELLSLLPGPSG